MTSRHAKRAKKKRQMLVESAIPAELQDATCLELRVIITDYFKLLLTLPVEEYGVLKSRKRFQFANAQSKILTTAGPSSLAEPMVAMLFELGMTNQQVSVSFEGDAVTKLASLVTKGVGAGIYILLGNLEVGLQNIPDSVLAKLSLGESEAETFRVLLKEFSGTFDELVEVARTL